MSGSLNAMTKHRNAFSQVRLNIGGHKFCTTVDTLTQREPDSMLAAMFNGCHTPHEDLEKGYVFLDRDGTHFRHILNWLRDGVVPLLKDCSIYSELLREAEYYQLLCLKDGIHASVNKMEEDDQNNSKSGADLTRSDIIKTKFISSNERLQFRGVNLSGLDLSKLDLSKVDFSNACLRNVCFSNCDLGGAKFNFVDAEGAIFQNASLTRTQSIGANFRDASFADANLEHAHLKGACLVNCNFRKANLEHAKLDGSDFTNGILEAASLKSAQLRNVDLTDANIERANLQWADLENLKTTSTTNFKDANLSNAYGQNVKFQHLTGAKNANRYRLM